MFSANPRQILELLHSGEGFQANTSQASAAVSIENSAAPRTRPQLSIIFGFAAIYLIWGSTYLGIRYAVETVPPLLMMGMRHFVAGTLVYGWARRNGAPAPTRKQWGYAAVAGLLLFLGGHGTLAWAEQKVASGLAALLSATLPLWTVLLSRMDRSERFSGRAWTGLGLGFAGVALLIGPDVLQQHLNLLAALVILGSALMWAVGTSYSRRVALPESKILSAAMQMISGGSILLMTSAIAGEPARFHFSAMTLKSALALGYLIVFGSVLAFTIYTWLVSVSRPTMLSTYAYVNPVVAVFLGWSLAGETLGLRTIAATVIILAGVGLVTRAGTRPPAEQKIKQPLVIGKVCETVGD